MQGKRYGRALVSTRASADDVRSCEGVDPGERGECHPARRGQVDSIHPDAETESLLGRSLSLNGLLKGVARTEGRNLLSRNPHLLPRLRVPAIPGFLLPHVELPEARDLHLIATL